MEILLDTNFIITCVKNKIDFVSSIDEMTDERVEWIVPLEVLQELEEISKRRGEREEDKLAAKIGLEMTRAIPAKIINVHNKNVDEGIKNYIGGKEIILATLDKGLKSKISNRILAITRSKVLKIT